MTMKCMRRNLCLLLFPSLFELASGFLSPLPSSSQRSLLPSRARYCRGALRSLIAYEKRDGGGVEMTQERMSKILVATKSLPGLPACLSPKDREARMRLADLLRRCTTMELVQQQFSDSIRDISLHFGRDAAKALLCAEQAAGGSGFRRVASMNTRLSSMVPESLAPDLRPRKPRVVVLGSGWGAHAIVKVIDTDKFDVVAVSPRPYFIFTPMLASAAVGTVEYRSITEPMRSSNPLVEYYEALATKIDTKGKHIFCESVRRDENAEPFRVAYDFLVVSIGMEPSTFGVPGVRENCYFLKDVDDARALRAAIVATFEAASLPSLTDEQRVNLLTFVVVGGGPTGVEFSGELFDFLQQDVKRYYPKLAPLVRTKLLQSGKGILETFDKNMQDMAIQSLSNQGMDIILNARVTAVTENEISYVQGEARMAKTTLLKDGNSQTPQKLSYGVCVWACGNAARPICKELISQHQSEATRTGRVGSRILVDPWLRMVGVEDGTVFALGDCAETEEGPLPQTAQVAAQQGAFVAHLLNDEINRAATAAGHTADTKLAHRYSPKVLEAVEKGVAQGDPVALALSQSDVQWARPFEFLSLGILAYIGNSRAIAQVELSSEADEGGGGSSLKLGGVAGWILWRSVYLTKQVAFRNRVLVLFDWVKSQVFGRDIACL